MSGLNDVGVERSDRGLDPRTGVGVGDPIPWTSGDQLEALLQEAKRATDVLESWTPLRRAGMLGSIADSLDRDAGELVELASRETGLTEQRLQGELQRTTGQLRMFSEVVLDGMYLRASVDHQGELSPDSRRTLVPVGVVAVWSAGNFPFAFSVAGGDTASALAAGCAVVVKAHPGHPNLSRRTAQSIQDGLARADAPPGAHNLIFGNDAGKELILDQRVAAAAFTGSLNVGRMLFDMACSRPAPIPFFGELGSINPVFITQAALAARGPEIASGLAQSFTLGAGQFCTKPGVVFVTTGRGSDFVKLVANQAAEQPPQPLLGRHTASAFARSRAELVTRRNIHSVGSAKATSRTEGWWEVPTVLCTTYSDFVADVSELTRECFGPLTLIVETLTDAELVSASDQLPSALTATVHAQPEDAGLASDLVRTLVHRAGRVVWNGWPTGVPVGWATQHGGPYPATTASGATSVGAAAIERFLRPVSFQGFPDAQLPDELKEANPWNVPRREDGLLTLPQAIGAHAVDGSRVDGVVR